MPSPFIGALGVLRVYWGIVGGRVWHLVLPLSMGVVIALIEGLSLALLIPLSDVVVPDSLRKSDSSGLVQGLLRWLPDPGLATDPGRVGLFTIYLIGLILICRVLVLSFEYVRRRFLDRRNEEYRLLARQATFSRVLCFGRQYFDRDALGRLDLEVGWASAVVEILVSAEALVLHGFRALVKAAVLISMSLPLFAALCLAFPLTRYLLRWIEGSSLSVARRMAEVETRQRTTVLDLFSNISLVKVHSQEHAAAASFKALLDEGRKLELKRRALQHLKDPVEEALLLLFLIAAGGASIWWTPDFQPGQLAHLVAFLLVAQQLAPDLGTIGWFRVYFVQQIPLLETMARLFSDDGKHIVPSGKRAFEGLQQGIVFRNLSFGYRPDALVLRDLSATIPAGKVTALLGESGAGKSTLTQLIMRLYDCPPGALFLDGVDIRDFSIESLHRLVAIVSQDVWLLNRSLRDNLHFGLPNAPDSHALQDVLAMVELDALVTTLPQGLDTLVGDRGIQLSGGQRQRLAFARAILRDPDVLILDEATSAIDSVVERKIEESIDQWARGRTVIVIAHRLSSVRRADQILVMKDGRITEAGGWDQLIAEDGAFAQLHKAQY